MATVVGLEAALGPGPAQHELEGVAAARDARARLARLRLEAEVDDHL